LRIFATYTDKSYYFTQIGFSVIIKEKDYDVKYILLLLNSLLINFYHKFKYLDTEKNLFQKILIENCKKFPIKQISLSAQQPFIARADQMITLNTNLHNLTNNFLIRLTDNFSAVKLTKKLENFSDLSFADFLTELKKQKVSLSLSEQDEWSPYFTEKKEKVVSLKREIEACDKEIDGMVFKLYGLSEEEAKVVRGE
jgi:hypothetical protein